MIRPSNGRVVWFTPPSNFAGTHLDRSQPLAATVVHVVNDRMVNLVVFDSVGEQFAQQCVPLLQDDDPSPAFGYFCEWMPYQKGQAAKTEALEQKLATA